MLSALAALVAFGFGFWCRGILRMQREKLASYAMDADQAYLDRREDPRGGMDSAE